MFYIIIHIRQISIRKLQLGGYSREFEFFILQSLNHCEIPLIISSVIFWYLLKVVHLFAFTYETIAALFAGSTIPAMKYILEGINNLIHCKCRGEPTVIYEHIYLCCEVLSGFRTSWIQL